MAIAVSLVLAGLLHIGYRSEFIPCTLDCGETYEAYIGALNLQRFGLGHAWGLQDFAAGPDPDAHPTVYTHNPNLGMYFRYALFRVGILDVHAQAVWSAVPFAAGLLYMYLLIRAVSGSSLLAALCLLNASLLYLLVMLWAFHGLRVFSWLLTFGPAYHLLRYAERPNPAPGHLPVAMLYLACSLGIDYPFAIFVGLSITAWTWLGVIQIGFRQALGIVSIALGVPFLLRQLQVALAMGPRFWAVDFAHSVLRRVPLVAAVAPGPGDVPIAQQYAPYKVLQWPSPTGFEPGEWIYKIGVVYWQILGPALPLAVAVWIGAEVMSWRAGGSGPTARVARLVTGLVSAEAVTFACFGGYFATFYGSALMPLLVHWIVPSLGMATYVLLANVKRTVRIGGSAVPVGAVLFALFILLRIEREISWHLALPPAGYPGRHELRQLRGHSFLTVWISSAVSAYTHQWAARLHDPRWREIRPEDLPFDPRRDYYFFFEADNDNPRYRTPDFLFLPAIHVPWVVDRRCNPFGGRVGLPVDGCTDLAGAAQRLRRLPRYRRGEDYLIYDLRPLYREARRTD